MIKTAVILAAGLGSRLKDVTKEMPKGFLEIGGCPIIEKSIEKLFEFGIKKIFIGTGYLSEAYEMLAANHHSRIQCIKNENFATTGSMYTLFNMRRHIHQDFLLLESDLIYDKNGLGFLINDPAKDVILASGKTNSNDEVFIEADEHNFLANMSKNPAELNNIHSELVGITKISIHTFRLMCEFAEKTFASTPKLDYEYALVNAAATANIFVKRINNFAWCEIDDEHHLERAKRSIYPQIMESEA